MADLLSEQVNDIYPSRKSFSHLEALHARIAFRFVRVEARQRALAYLQGLLCSLERKNGWQLARHAGENTPDGMQRLLNTAVWNADSVCADLREYVAEHLGDVQGVLVISEESFIKKGSKSVGVTRQYSTAAGKIENCQIGIFIAYSNQTDYALIDRELYLPKEWIEDEERRKEASIQEIAFATKSQLALAMLNRVMDSNIVARWVTGGKVYGKDRKLRHWLESREQAYVLALPEKDPLSALARQKLVFAPGEEHITGTRSSFWWQPEVRSRQRTIERYEWARIHIAQTPKAGWNRWLLVRRCIDHPTKCTYYVVFGPESTRFEDMLAVIDLNQIAKKRFTAARREVGLDEYEVRHLHGWYRHITLAMLALACLAVVHRNIPYSN